MTRRRVAATIWKYRLPRSARLARSLAPAIYSRNNVTYFTDVRNVYCVFYSADKLQLPLPSRAFARSYVSSLSHARSARSRRSAPCEYSSRAFTVCTIYRPYHTAIFLFSNGNIYRRPTDYERGRMPRRLLDSASRLILSRCRKYPIVSRVPRVRCVRIFGRKGSLARARVRGTAVR